MIQDCLMTQMTQEVNTILQELSLLMVETILVEEMMLLQEQLYT